MNIFVLSKNPIIAAKYHCDKHIVKMPLETAQMLNTVLHRYGKENVYKPAFQKHPCTIWAGESSENFNWLVNLGLNLCKEFTKRYNKVHKCEQVINYCNNNKPIFVKNELTNFAQAMPDDVKHMNAVVAYRNYYLKYKTNIVTWKTKIPVWYSKNFLTIQN